MLVGPRDLRLTFRVEGVDQLARTLQGIAGVVSDLTPAWRRIAAEVIFPSILMNFAAGGRPLPWEMLSARYAARKLRLWGPKPILVAGGRLLATMSAPNATPDTITEYHPMRLEAGFRGNTQARTGMFYGIFHTSNQPRRKMPHRPFLMIQAEDVEPIVRIVHQHVISGMSLEQRRDMGVEW